MENYTPIYVNHTQIENVESYIYLGQRYSTRDKNKDNEFQRRITAGWTAFTKHRDIWNMLEETRLQLMRTSTNDIQRGNMGNQPITTQAKNKLAAAQTKMEKSMLNITYRERKTKHLGKRKGKGHRRD